MRKEDLTVAHMDKFMSDKFPSHQIVEKMEDGFILQNGSTYLKIMHKTILDHANLDVITSQHKGNIYNGLNDQDLGFEYSNQLRLIGIPESITSVGQLTPFQRQSAIQSGIDGPKLESLIRGRARIVDAAELEQQRHDRAESMRLKTNDTRPSAESLQAQAHDDLLRSHGAEPEAAPAYNYGNQSNASTVGKH